MFFVGQTVVIRKSPYDCVPAGTVGTVGEVRLNWGGRGVHLVIVSGLRCTAFWSAELESL